MFKKNTKHSQGSLFSFINTLPSRQQKLLQQSEEYKFYEIIFCSINEEDFSVLFSETDSRPNAPVNALVSALILMNRYSWSYEELFKNINFNLLTKTALGLKSLDEIPFCSATIFNFQNRLNKYQTETGINLLEKAFDYLTKGQLDTLKIKTNIQRTDSTFAASNIRNYSRLQLLIEVLIRLYRSINEADKQYFYKELKPYVGGTSENYVYAIKPSDIPLQIEKLGTLYYRLHQQLKGRYCEDKAFEIFERVYKEHFKTEEEKVVVKLPEEISSSSIQSPDDIDAAYRNKNGKSSKGQTINITETANPDNTLNLLTDVSVQKNNIDDSKVLETRIEKIKEKTPDIEELHFDGAYGSKNNDVKFEELEIQPVQTAIRGREARVAITIEELEDNQYKVGCPNQAVLSVPGRKKHKAIFSLKICSKCPLAALCPTKQNNDSRVYYFDRTEYLKRKRLTSINKIPVQRQKLRNNIEATVSEFKRKMHSGKLKVRGYFKTTVFAFSMAISINFGRIFRHISDYYRRAAQSFCIERQYVSNLCVFGAERLLFLENLLSTLFFTWLWNHKYDIAKQPTIFCSLTNKWAF
ncbi:MAG TPA: DDE transposase [Ignavibacteria bacterium]|nr:DDE transposase [Ignavibacteria bacterium]